MSEDGRSGIFREVNERIAQITDWWEWEETQGFLCECVQSDCTQTLLLSQAQYEDVRARPAHFFTIPGHERSEQDRVLERHDGFVVVEKLGVYRREAELEDPRRAQSRSDGGRTSA